MQTLKLKILLVPGTWAARVQRAIDAFKFKRFDETMLWSHPESAFSKNLIADLKNNNIEASVKTANWTQKNSFRSRAASAESIETEIDGIRRTDPNVPICIIAHSHGGNAALQAWALHQNKSSPLHLITLATPFLNVREITDVTPYLPHRLLISSVYAIDLLLASALMSYIVLRVPPETMIWPLGYAVKHYGSAYVITVYLTSMAGIIALYRTVAGRAQRWFNSKRENNKKYLKTFLNLKADESTNKKFAVIKIDDDEALFAIATASFIKRAPSYLLKIVNSRSKFRFFWTTYLMAAVPMVGYLLYNVATRSEFTSSGSTLAAFVFLFLVVFPIMFIAVRVTAIMILSALILTLQSFGGAEMFIGENLYAVKVDSTPDGIGGEKKTLDSDLHKELLRHSVYLHPQCIESIMESIMRWTENPSISSNNIKSGR